MTILEVEVTKLKPASYNPRTITEKAFENLQRSIDTFGMPQPVIVNQRNMTIVGGHQRWLAAKKLNWETVPVVFVDLEDSAEKKLNIMLNDAKFQGTFETDLLAEVLHGFTEDELADLDYSDDEINKLQDGWAETEDELKPKEKTYTKRDLYDFASHYDDMPAANRFVDWLP